MRSALAIVLAVACGGAEPGNGQPDGGRPDAGGGATPIRLMLYYGITSPLGPYCCNDRVVCNPYLDMTTDVLANMQARYSGCLWTKTQSLYEIDCTANCGRQSKNCGQGLVCSQWACAPPVGASADRCAFYYP